MSRIQSDAVALAADNLCCCQDRLSRLKPLTIEWFKTAMQPRYGANGEVTYVLTPPRRPVVNGSVWIGATFFLLFLFAAVTWARALGVFG